MVGRARPHRGAAHITCSLFSKIFYARSVWIRMSAFAPRHGCVGIPHSRRCWAPLLPCVRASEPLRCCADARRSPRLPSSPFRAHRRPPSGRPCMHGTTATATTAAAAAAAWRDRRGRRRRCGRQRSAGAPSAAHCEPGLSLPQRLPVLWECSLAWALLAVSSAGDGGADDVGTGAAAAEDAGREWRQSGRLGVRARRRWRGCAVMMAGPRRATADALPPLGRVATADGAFGTCCCPGTPTAWRLRLPQTVAARHSGRQAVTWRGTACGRNGSGASGTFAGSSQPCNGRRRATSRSAYSIILRTFSGTATA